MYAYTHDTRLTVIFLPLFTPAKKRVVKILYTEISKNLNKTSINNINVIGKYMKDTYKNLNKSKKGLVLKKNSEIIDLIKNDIDNNDYLMIKGSNSTGLNKLTKNIKMGKINAL